MGNLCVEFWFIVKPVFCFYMKFILGKKIDMTQVWRGDDAIAVTRVQAGPCVVAQVKDEKNDGYQAVQIGYGEKKEKNIRKPQLGHLKKLSTQSGENKKSKTNLRYLREFRIDNVGDLKIGNMIDVSTFQAGDIVKVTGTSKGKGFQGVVKRHGFHGQDKGHGNKDQMRMPGAIGAGEPQHVFKGTRMGGRMGGDRVSLSNSEIVEVDIENNILFIKGAVPGARNGLIMIVGEGELKKSEPLSEPLISTENTENTEAVEVKPLISAENTDDTEKAGEVKVEEKESN
jgi:large subunit ribosomal protein L3